MTAQYSTENQYDWRTAQFQHCNMYPQAAYNQDYNRSDYASLLETNYAQAQITQVQINQVTTFSRMKDENAYPPAAHAQLQNHNVARNKPYSTYAPNAHSTVALSEHLQKTKLDTDQNSNSNLPSNTATNINNSSYNWVKNEEWSSQGSNATLPALIGNDQHQIQNYYHQNAQRNYWS